VEEVAAEPMKEKKKKREKKKASEDSEKEAPPAKKQRTESDSKYLPPHLRSRAQATNVSQLRVQLRALFNRVSDGNLDVIMNQVLNALRTTGATAEDAAVAFAEELLPAALENPQNVLVLVGCCAGLTVAVNALVGPQFGAVCIVKAEEHLKRDLHEALTQAASYERDNHKSKARNSVTYLSLLFAYEMLSGASVFSLIRSICSSVTHELHLELCLTVMRYIGGLFRSRNPEDFKDMIDLMIVKAQKFKESAVVESVSRLDFLIRELLEIKKSKGSFKAMDRLNPIRAWFTSSHLLKRLKFVDFQLEPPWDLLAGSPPDGWWKKPMGAARRTGTMAVGTGSAEQNELLVLAQAQRMTTDQRRGMFIAIMGAEDVRHAVARVSELIKKPKQVEEAVTVLLHCCITEKAYNPFYAALAVALTNVPGVLAKRFAHAVKAGVTNQLREVHTFSPTSLASFVMFFGKMMDKGLIVLAAIRFLAISEALDAGQASDIMSNVGLFLRGVLEHMLQKMDLVIVEGACTELRKYEDLREMVLLVARTQVAPRIHRLKGDVKPKLAAMLECLGRSDFDVSD